MPNQQIADIFDQMADIMEILGDDHFRVATYRKVARVIHDCPHDVASLAADNTLQDLPGIGKSSAAKINEFVHHGSIQAHQQLLKKIPTGLLDLLKIPGVGPKGVAAMWKELGITNLNELRQSIQQNKLQQLPHFGDKKAESIMRGIEFVQAAQGRILLAHAIAIADVIAGQLSMKTPAAKTIELAGSARRACETVGDIDLLAQAQDGTELIEAFTKLPGTQQILASGDTKASILFADPNICHNVVQVDLRVVPSESIGAARQYFTGSKYHNIKLREIASHKKFKLNEYGLYKGEKLLAGQTEQQIYKKLSMAYIPPTMREDRGEIELAQQNKLPAVVQLADIRADLHMHSPQSDGIDPIETLAAAAIQLGYEYIAITDHSQSSAIANGLDIPRLRKHIKHIHKLNETIEGITILASSEVDILMDGSLDYPDDILAQLDFVMASIHSGMTGPQDKLTHRLMTAMENPYVNCIGHPTGRMINVREPMKLDMPAIIAHAAATGTALEISSSPLRLDLNDIHTRLAVDAGVYLAIDTDAHDAAGLKLMRFGVATAQRGWAKKSDILNCQPLTTLRKWIQKKRHNLS